jgi:hypothetical protein
VRAIQQRKEEAAEQWRKERERRWPERLARLRYGWGLTGMADSAACEGATAGQPLF